MMCVQSAARRRAEPRSSVQRITASREVISPYLATLSQTNPSHALGVVPYPRCQAPTPAHSVAFRESHGGSQERLVDVRRTSQRASLVVWTRRTSIASPDRPRLNLSACHAGTRTPFPARPRRAGIDCPSPPVRSRRLAAAIARLIRDSGLHAGARLPACNARTARQVHPAPATGRAPRASELLRERGAGNHGRLPVHAGVNAE
jgi:hypothetical protein